MPMLLVGWLMLSGFVAVAANFRGRSGIGWFLISIIISPLLALILVLALPSVALPRRMRVDIYDGKARRYRRVRLDKAVNPDDLGWVGQEILSDGFCKYRGHTIYETGQVRYLAH